MANLFDYLDWRGDLTFEEAEFNEVDSMILAWLSYAALDGIVPADCSETDTITIEEASERFVKTHDVEKILKEYVSFTKTSVLMLQKLAVSRRFRNLQLTGFVNRIDYTEESQFCAMTVLLKKNRYVVVFRGTDDSLIGWKEDFNMSFQDSVPAQREAAAYVAEVAQAYPAMLRLGGHSKGGNLAVYAAAKVNATIQKRILEVYNLDGPGFTENMLRDAGYLAIVPKIKTYIPESSIIGMLLERRDTYCPIKSRQLGLLQHEPYSWEIQAGDFEHAEAISWGNRFAGETIAGWIRDMNAEEREAFVDATYELLSASGASSVGELLHPKNVLAFFKALNAKEETRKLLSGEFLEFLKAAYASLPKNEKT